MEHKYWICYECGIKYGKARDSVTTFHEDTCDYCGEVKSVCAARNYGWPKGEDNDRTND